MKQLTTGVALASLLLAGCGSGDTVSPGAGGPITQADARAIAEEVRGEMDAFTDGSSVPDLLTPSLALDPGAVRGLSGPIRFRPHDPDCPTPSENPPTDTDGDGVPDNLVLTFDPALCTFTNHEGNVVHELSGTITVSDPSADDRGFLVVWGDFQGKTTIDGTVFFLRRIAGPWQQVKSATGFSLIDSTVVNHESSERPPSSLAKAWRVDFVADAGAEFSHHWRLPSGTLTVNGSTERTRDTVTRSFSVETVTPLHFNSSCTERPRIDAGELHIVHTGPNGTATITIVFTGCGQEPVVTLVTGPTAS